MKKSAERARFETSKIRSLGIDPNRLESVQGPSKTTWIRGFEGWKADSSPNPSPSVFFARTGIYLCVSLAASTSLQSQACLAASSTSKHQLASEASRSSARSCLHQRKGGIPVRQKRNEGGWGSNRPSSPRNLESKSFWGCLHRF